MDRIGGGLPTGLCTGPWRRVNGAALGEAQRRVNGAKRGQDVLLPDGSRAFAGGSNPQLGNFIRLSPMEFPRTPRTAGGLLARMPTWRG